MSRIIASAAIRGAHRLVRKAEEKWRQAVDAKGPSEPVEFPNTGYYLPVIYGLTGRKVQKLSDLEPVLGLCRELLPEEPKEHLWTPYLGTALDAGVATLFAEETIEAVRYVMGPNPVEGIWLGAADDVIMRERGIEFVDGRAPGFAAVVGAAPDAATAVRMAKEMQQKNLYIFMAGQTRGVQFAQQLAEAGEALGWNTRLVPYGMEIEAQIYSLGFATRAALSFGGVAPGDYQGVLRYNKNRIFAFVIALGEVTDEWYATAAGAISYGFPTIADTPIPQILPTGVCTYEHVVSDVPHDKIVAKAVEVRGLKVAAPKLKLPVAFGPAFEGEIIRRADTYVQMGGNESPAFELVRMRELSEVEDGKIEIIGPDLDGATEGKLPLATIVDVAGRKMNEDFEPVLERRIHDFINYLEGVTHNAQRDILRIRVNHKARAAGLSLRHFGEMIYTEMKSEYQNVVDKVQITFLTEEAAVLAGREEARRAYAARDARIASLTDDTVEEFYTCTLCQSFAPNHVCIVAPERIGLCGSVNWFDAKAANQLKPGGANVPVYRGEVIDALRGQYAGINEMVKTNSHGTLEALNLYSMMENPMTSCGCFEVILAVVPEGNGVLAVNREHTGMTPTGMKFSTMAGMVGGGMQTPGFMGVGKHYLTSKKFIQADGGLLRVIWMPKQLKELLREGLERRAAELGVPDLLDRIADEDVGTTAEEILPFLEEKGHPALTMDPIM